MVMKAGTFTDPQSLHLGRKKNISFRLLGIGGLDNTRGLHQGHQTWIHLVFQSTIVIPTSSTESVPSKHRSSSTCSHIKSAEVWDLFKLSREKPLEKLLGKLMPSQERYV